MFSAHARAVKIYFAGKIKFVQQIPYVRCGAPVLQDDEHSTLSHTPAAISAVDRKGGGGGCWDQG